MKRFINTDFGEKITVPVGLLAALLYAIGGPWDQYIHVHQGHTLLATPHLIIAGGLSMYVSSGILAFFILRGARFPVREQNSLKLIMLGASVLPFGLVIDESWHRIFGTDMTAWSPPHIVIFFGMISSLLGLASLEAARSRQTRGRFSWSYIRLVFFFTSIFFVALFFFIDFDVPGMAYITKTRPDFSYAIAQIGVVVFLALLTATVTRRVGTATAAAFLAWGYYTGIGLELGVIDIGGDSPHRILPPFPLVVPVLAADLLFFFLLKKRFSLPIYRGWIVACVSALVCYAGIIAWSEFYTHLPQQGPESAILWIPYALLALAIALCAEAAAFLLCRWTLKDKKT